MRQTQTDKMNRERLALGELRTLAGLLQTVLLALDHTQSRG